MRRVASHDHSIMPAVGSAGVYDAQEHPMMDILMLALALGFFAAGIGYAYVCERL